jgi:hypothetical protein
MQPQRQRRELSLQYLLLTGEFDRLTCVSTGEWREAAETANAGCHCITQWCAAEPHNAIRECAPSAMRCCMAVPGASECRAVLHAGHGNYQSRSLREVYCNQTALSSDMLALSERPWEDPIITTLGQAALCGDGIRMHQLLCGR